MCLIVVGWHSHPDYPLVVAANRDEFYGRPSAAVARWNEDGRIIAGRDLEAGGTWLGITEGGRFAAITNVREPGAVPGPRSRGDLTREFLAGSETPARYLARVRDTDFSGFNLLLADRHQLWYASNRHGPPQALEPGIYGLSNHFLDSPWPKLLTARRNFAAALPQLPDTNPLFALLADDEIVADDALPHTGVSLEWERRLSAIFVRSADYGTRASTVVTRSLGGALHLEERSFGPHGQALQSSLISTGV